MNVQSALKTQYHASLSMLKDTITRCPNELWAAGKRKAFWHVAYHALYFTHLYLMPDEESFRPWQHHRKPETGKPYTKAQVLEYWQICDAMVDTCVDGLDLSAKTCGFPWYNLPKLDHQINNIRHIQHHAAALAIRLREAGINPGDWKGRA